MKRYFARARDWVFDFFVDAIKLDRTWAQFFWVVTILWTFSLGALFFEFFRWPTESGVAFKAPPQLIWLYLSVLSVYIVSDRTAHFWKLRSGKIINRPGGLFVIIWVGSVAVMYGVGTIWDVQYKIPDYIEWYTISMIILHWGSMTAKKFIMKKLGIPLEFLGEDTTVNKQPKEDFIIVEDEDSDQDKHFEDD